MAWPALVAVAKAVPWLALVQQAPAILAAAEKIRSKGSRKSESSLDQKPRVPGIEEIQKALEQLQNQDRETAEVVRQLAAQNMELAASIRTLAAKTKALGYGLLVAGVIALSAAVKAFA